MNNSPLQQIVRSVDKALSPMSAGNNNQTTRSKKNGQKENTRSRRQNQRPQNQGSRPSGISRNPGERRRPNNTLSLTRSQFTATSPLNLFNVGAGSTPGGIRVSGRELLGAVTVPIATGVWVASTTFPGTGVASSLNPLAFPRLAAYDPIYEYFKFHKCTFLFQSNQPTTATGEIVMSFDYDPDDTPPASTQAQMRNISATMANIYSDASLEVLSSLSRLPKYECGAAGALQARQGALTVAVEGYSNVAVSTVGYVIAQYDVEFFTPQ